ncbi:leucine rich repeat domain-containing protein [Naegleria gruberi]|uniref:Leucine rich repeat domain-containing protein n=1 Tax=Naegleria gruberi TaxID=5762 RepID=D2V9S3_NAEGR|nr:leucine rich repeat domain-containing protein [Naegleria gruberi]EFC46632.1 leucine rich repeat domain-containing protein [Naegleria gruberi]|eukprot:XP_002679376.1 leucine rich repeat domain-containing protein [Naegleria gruberi strain NEG-M]
MSEQPKEQTSTTAENQLEENTKKHPLENSEDGGKNKLTRREENLSRSIFTIKQRKCTNGSDVGIMWDLTATYLRGFDGEGVTFKLEEKDGHDDTSPIIEFYGSRNFLSKFPTNEITLMGRKVLTSSLVKLNLSCNDITEFPPLKELVNLRELMLSNNKITEMNNPDLQYCKNLRRLDLKINRINKIQYLPLPEDNATSNKLEYLSLSSNQISEIPEEEIRKCGNIKHLGFYGNLITTPLETLLDFISQFCQQSLSELWLQSNPITPVDSVIADENVIGCHSRFANPERVQQRVDEMTLVHLKLPSLCYYNGQYLVNKSPSSTTSQN